MTLKQKRLIEAIPSAKNLTEAAKTAGYSKSFAEHRVHTYVGECRELKKYFDEDSVKKEIKQASKLFKKCGDNSNYARMIELKSKIVGLTKDTLVNITLDITKEAIKLRYLYQLN